MGDVPPADVLLAADVVCRRRAARGDSTSGADTANRAKIFGAPGCGEKIAIRKTLTVAGRAIAGIEIVKNDTTSGVQGEAVTGP